jgi:hypothetical protein
MDGTNGSTTFTDSSLNALAVTAVGNAQISTTQSKYGGASAYFDGSGDAVQIPYSAALDLTSGDFTIEGWVYFNSVSGTPTIITPFGTGNTFGGWVIVLNSSSQFAFYLSTAANTWNGPSNVLFSATAATTGTWYHFALVRNGSTFTPYLNGIAGTTATFSSTLYNNSKPLKIGAEKDSNGFPLNGYIDDLRITKYARYTSAFTPPAAALPDIYNPNTTLPVTGAALWLDASQQNTLFTDAGTTPVTTSGQSIYQWNDLSGNNRHAVQATAGERPTWVPPASGQNGLGAVRCSTSLETRIYYSTLSSSSKTIFIVHKGVASGLMDTRLFTVNGDYKVNIGSTSTTLSFVRELIAWTNSGFSKIYNPTVFNLTYTNTPSFSAVLSKSESAGSTTIQTIFSQGGGSGYPDYLSQSGDYYEVVLFTRTLTTTEISSMNNYLRSKWGTP